MSTPATYDPDKLRQAASVDLDVFAGLVIPHVVIYRFPAFYSELWKLCIKSFLDLSPNNKLFKLLLVLPRGHAKTTFIKLLVAYGIIHRLFNFILVVCASDNNAENFIEDVVAMLSHENVRQLYGDWEAGVTEQNSTERVSSFMGRRVMFRAASILSGDIRGTNKFSERPDFIVADDIQTKEVAESPRKTELVEDAFVGTVMKSKSPHRCGIIYMGNSYPRNCIADKLANSGEFITLRTGGVLADGTALWEDLHSLEALRAEWRLDCALGKAHIWMAEVQNQPLEKDGLQPLFPSGDVPITHMPADAEICGAFVTVDPAGRKRTSDDTGIAGHVIYEGDVFELAEVTGYIRDPRRTIIDAIAVAERISAPIIFVEAVAYQESLAFWGTEVLQELGLADRFQFIPLTVGSMAKLARIRAWVGELLAGAYIISTSETKERILYQGLQFQADRTDNVDDILDVSSAGTVVRNKHLAMVKDAYVTYKDLSPAKDCVTVSAAWIGKLRARYAH